MSNHNGYVQPVTIVGGGGGGAVQVQGLPGTIISTPPNTALPAGTVPLPVAAAGTRRVRVQVTGGDETTQVLIRELAGTAGDGIMLLNNGSTMYGGGDGAVADLEAQLLAGAACVVRVQAEG